ncbi:hypothetical protein LOTGIDRAFT_106739 [Lottia gigantea]|uniref:Major facilitator superfamily (MFS) profile domain-containing protein n=1 Tax=Lottia gigantea TaxID=225164 RepID=V3ZX77_LOTGI|nr:hypothetical protein LOTGIDRAFT_106739 [Lottia gigantea]ESO88972.1 hypothetical protein LOTGIDRAFT_106739 [Lottia gigantea]
MDFEEIIKALGDFGPYQKRVYFLMCLTSTFTAVQVMATVFTFGVPDHRCSIPGVENDTYNTGSFSSQEYHYNNSIYRECTITEASDNTTSTNPNVCHQWVYDKSVFESTIVSDMDLVCDKKLGKSHAQMLIMLGQVTGCVLVGPLSDLFGRRSMLMTFLIILIISSIAVTWTPMIGLHLTLAFYFFIGTSISGSFTPAFVIGLELVGPSKRVFTGIITELFWSAGLVILSGVAYWIKNTQYLQLVISVPSLTLISFFWFVTESPRWLINKGRYREAEKIIREAARVNKVVLPERIFRGRSRSKDVKQMSILKIFSSKILLSRTLVLYFIWAVCSLTFYGLSLNAGSLSGSVHLNFFLLSVIEIPAYIICIVLLDRIGRRFLQCGSLLLSGTCLLLSVFTVLYTDKSLEWITTLLAVIGKMGVTAAFAIIWIYTTELYPTVLRNSGVGSSNLMARIAGAISPYIANLQTFLDGDIGKVAPLIIFGLASVLAGLLMLFLPETKGKRLPETVEDAEQFTQ